MPSSTCLNRREVPEDLCYIENQAAIDSPALVVDPDLVARNIRQALAMVDPERGTYLRPHVKTHKTREVVRMMMQQGIDRFKCSTIAEAEMLGMAGATDVLLAYPLTSLKAHRLAKLRIAFPDICFSCLVDHPQTAAQLSELFANDPLPVFIDLDVGMHRTGISPEKAPEFFAHCQALPGIRPVGLHAYDGHIHAPDSEQRKREANTTYALVRRVQEEIEARPTEPLIIVIGGSPSFPFHAQRERVECSPGTFPFWDAGYGQAFPEMKFVPAVRLLTRVISIIDDQRLCLDVGSKAVAADAAWPRLVFPDHPEAEAVSQSEEHLVVQVPDTANVRLGEEWWGIPLHICPTVNLYESLHVIRNQRWDGDWEVIARRRKLTI